MTRFAIDAGVLLTLAEAGFRSDPERPLAAPNSIRADALAILLRRVAAGELTERDALELHEQMTIIKLRALNDRVSRRVAWDLAREHGWLDLHLAGYLAVARLQADALIAADPQLIAAADGVVALEPINRLL